MGNETQKTVNNARTVLIILVLTGCSEQSSPPDIILDENHEGEEIIEDLPENVSFWGFDEGDFDGWEHFPGWSIEGVIASGVGLQEGIFTEDQWVDFHLFARLEIDPESTFAIHFREGAGEGGYQVLIQPNNLSLLFVSNGVVND